MLLNKLQPSHWKNTTNGATIIPKRKVLLIKYFGSGCLESSLINKRSQIKLGINPSAIKTPICRGELGIFF